jgi:(4S)-4-hydroxy-5-phosphonooxypentane-2,3-dione isomerase
LAKEPGCTQFHVSIDLDDSNHVLLYETYVDEEAFERHKETPHFAVWRSVAQECVERQVSTRARLCHERAGHS